MRGARRCPAFLGEEEWDASPRGARPPHCHHKSEAGPAPPAPLPPAGRPRRSRGGGGGEGGGKRNKIMKKKKSREKKNTTQSRSLAAPLPSPTAQHKQPQSIPLSGGRKEKSCRALRAATSQVSALAFLPGYEEGEEGARARSGDFGGAGFYGAHSLPKPSPAVAPGRVLGGQGGERGC